MPHNPFPQVKPYHLPRTRRFWNAPDEGILWQQALKGGCGYYFKEDLVQDLLQEYPRVPKKSDFSQWGALWHEL